jgi:hypothetical protein
MIPGRGFPNWPIAVEREKRRQLTRAANQILASDRRQQRRANEKVSGEQTSFSHAPVNGHSSSKWAPLSELRRVIREMEEHK